MLGAVLLQVIDAAAATAQIAVVAPCPPSRRLKGALSSLSLLRDALQPHCSISAFLCAGAMTGACRARWTGPHQSAARSLLSGIVIASDSHRAREVQHESCVGEVPGSSKSDPAGMITSRPLRVVCGRGEPQRRQKQVEKLRASRRSKRTTFSGPALQRNACGKTYAFAANALPLARRHREQWHFTNFRNGNSASNATDRHRHPPRTITFRPLDLFQLEVPYLVLRSRKRRGQLSRVHRR